MRTLTVAGLRQLAADAQALANRLDEENVNRALAAVVRPAWAPMGPGFVRTDPQVLARALEGVRRRVCAYGSQGTQTCDCKYGMTADDERFGSERTGCPELRCVIEGLLMSVGNTPVTREDSTDGQV